jgi:N-acyl-D-aspartate/D-glutamate deacylase
MALNFMTLTGHGNLQACTTGYQDRKLTAAEKKEMAALLMQAIRQGAAGLSNWTDLSSGIYSNTEELIEFRDVQNHIYTTHMRSEGTTYWNLSQKRYR